MPPRATSSAEVSPLVSSAPVSTAVGASVSEVVSEVAVSVAVLLHDVLLRSPSLNGTSMPVAYTMSFAGTVNTCAFSLARVSW